MWTSKSSVPFRSESKEMGHTPTDPVVPVCLSIVFGFTWFTYNLRVCLRQNTGSNETVTASEWTSCSRSRTFSEPCDRDCNDINKGVSTSQVRSPRLSKKVSSEEETLHRGTRRLNERDRTSITWGKSLPFYSWTHTGPLVSDFGTTEVVVCVSLMSWVTFPFKICLSFFGE